jgi:hypothetical protein
MYLGDGIENYRCTVGQNNDRDYPFSQLAIKVMGRSIKNLHQCLFHEFMRRKDEIRPVMS